MSEYDAVVYDLDGTIVQLAVDWAAVTSDVRGIYEDADSRPPAGDLWTLLDEADEYAIGEAVRETVAEYERAGAHSSRRLRHADELLAQEVPVGICSLNCEDACQVALTEHDLTDAVEVVIGRDSVGTHKPDPGPLLEVARRLGAEPARTLFVGDSISDQTTAERAGTAFRFV